MAQQSQKMSLSICTSCLTRLSLRSPSNQVQSVVIRTQTLPFTSSAVQHNKVLKKKVIGPGYRPPKLRQSQSARMTKKSNDRPRPLAVGERRMQKERIVLSNTNALEIQGLEQLSAENSTDAGRVGQMLAFNGPLLDQLREAKVFKTTQNWNMFRTPSTLHRSATVDVGLDIKSINENKKTVCAIVNGDRGSGKSIHLLQAMSLAFMNEWIVINIPEGQDYVTNTSAYRPIPRADEVAEQMYSQHQLASDLLQRLTRSNDKVLKALKLLHNHNKTIGERQIGSIFDLANLGVHDPRLAPQVWEAVWKELTSTSETQAVSESAPTQPQKKGTKAPAGPTRIARPPLMIAVDGINHWMTLSAYRNADYKFVHAQNFTMVKQFTDLIFSKTENPLPNGGMILGATTLSNNPHTPDFDVLLQQINARKSGMALDDKAFPMRGPYAKVDAKVFDLLQRSNFIRITRLNGLTRPESRALLEYFAKSGVFRETITDNLVNEKWTLSGGGVIGEICKFGKRLRKDRLDTKPNEGIRIKV